MKSMVTARDMRLMDSLFPYEGPEKLPVSFIYDGMQQRGIGGGFKPRAEVRRPDSRMIQHIVTGENPDGLRVRVEYTRYLDYAGCEILAFFENASDKTLPILSDVKILDGVIPWEGARLSYGNGDTLRPDGYEWFESDLSAPISLAPADGTSCNGAFPYMRLQTENFGANIAVGWPAMWKADLSRTDGGVKISAGQKRCRMALRPGEVMRTPRATIIAYEGDMTRGTNMWRRWYMDHIMPRRNGRTLEPKLCLHVYEADGKPEFTGATEEMLLTGFKNYIDNGLKPDVWWVDAGWYKCDFQWMETGTWEFDRERFPDALTESGRLCAENDCDLMLWFEPERVRAGTRLAEEHPEWMLHWTQADGTDSINMLADLGDSRCCDSIIENIDRIIKQSHVTIYRQDFNFDPAPYWEENEADDRIGAMENFHVQGYLRLWDTLRELNPGLLIDSCASGGRRNDLETMRRAVPFHYTDVGYGDHVIKQKQHHQMFGWIPYFRAHNKNGENPKTGDYDGKDRPQNRYSYYVAMAPSMTDIIEHDACEAEYELAREMNAIWRRAAGIMLEGDYYPLTKCRKSQEDHYAVQFHDPDSEKGFFEVVRNNRCPDDIFTAQLRALDADAVYEITEAETGETQTAAGRDLAGGFEVSIPRRSGRIYFYRRIN